MNNKWLMACLLIGSVLAVAMVSSIPLYTGGILQRMLVKDMEQFQQDRGFYPGRYVVKLNAFTYYNAKDRLAAYRWFNQEMEGATVDRLDVPVVVSMQRLGMDHVSVLPETQREEQPEKRFMGLFGITDFEKHIKLVAGRMPAKTAVNGVYEVLISQEAQSQFNLLLDEVEVVTDETKMIPPIKVRIVGVYARPDAPDVWWSEPPTDYSTAMVMNYDLFWKDICQANNAIASAYWYYALDYTKITVDGLDKYVTELDAQRQSFSSNAAISWEYPAQSILQDYSARAKQLRLTLWVLQVPILLMLAFYIFMVSQLIVENDRNEIAVYKSRGASRSQVFTNYLLQSVILSGVSVAVGPIVAMGICRVLGAANGFLELVSRTALPLKMNWTTILYAVYAGGFSVVMMMIPAMMASRTSIVEVKQKKARQWNAPLWQKLFLDFILLGVSVYGLQSYNKHQLTLAVTAAKGMDVPIDPLLFVISTLFVLGCGLLFLRIYPFLVRFISWIGRKRWTPVLYTSLVQVGRSGGREQFLMLFLILTISIGVFSANSARTINRNIEDRVLYNNGADLTLQMQWPSNEKLYVPPILGPGGPPQDSNEDATASTVVIYQEPPFEKYSKLSGTTAAARVFMPESVAIDTAGSSDYKNGKLMAIQPDEFGKVVWSSPGLLPYHINNYLNLLTFAPNAVLVSQKTMDDLKLSVGDSITCSWENQAFEATVVGSVPLWPGINPYEEDSQYFMIANLGYVQGSTSIQPYQIWYKCDPNATTKQIYDDIASREMNVTWVHDSKQDIILKKNDPLLQGTNGAMTLGFCVTIAVSMIGFFIYWILSIQARTLQFGILRAMGMSAGKVILTLVFEQLMVSGAAIIMGLVIGGLMSQLFVPLLGLVYSAAEQVPPFKVVTSRADYLRLYAIIAAMLAAGLALLGGLVKRIKVSQAIKLGED